ncbi:MAG: AmmeMemoRadiSam system protein A [Brockia lithotrophica]|nr:AmmeMemoRadiSam system protein A [Brockia lithotrophica]
MGEERPLVSFSDARPTEAAAPFGRIVGGALVPHPPVMVPEVGGKEARRVAQTWSALKALGRKIAALRPEVVFFLTPHGPVRWEAVPVVRAARLEGDLGRFGAPEAHIVLRSDPTFAEAVAAAAEAQGVPTAFEAAYPLDHAVVAPLLGLRAGGFPVEDVPTLVLGLGLLGWRRLMRFGRALRAAAHDLGKRALVVASGDLSHRLSAEGPYGYAPEGPEFDARIRDIFVRAAAKELLDLDPRLVEGAGECGFRPLLVLFGALEGLPVETEVLSYEAPFGVGYLVGFARVREDDPFDPPRLARRALEHFLATGEYLRVPRSLSPLLARPRGVFVTLHKDDLLRGCVGTVEPTQPTLYEEIVRNAVAAAREDPRFPPLRPEELPDVRISVDVLEPPEEVVSLEDLDPCTYGVVVEAGRRRGLLLPDLPGIDTPEEQVRIALRKAGIPPGTPYRLYRFRVRRFLERP